MTRKKRREAELYRPVLRLFAGHHDAYAEVPFCRRSVDLVFVSQDETPAVIAIELKVSDWKQALAQASTNQLFADESYVALAEGSIASKFEKEAKRWFCDLGVGLINVGDSASISLPAKRLDLVGDLHREAITRILAQASETPAISREEFENGAPAKSRRTTAFLPARAHERAGPL